MAELKVALNTDPSKAGNLIFNFKLPKSGLALRSARLVDNVPEFSFNASRNVPTILEEDVATAFRLASENKRPEFFYISFPLTHPMYGCRFFKYHSPLWLRHTAVGELLAEADWSMKCVSLGMKTNEDKTIFKSWSQSSQLKDLAASCDFPIEKKSSSIIMSCDHAKVQKSDNQIMFPEEPKMKITDGTTPLYTDYVTDKYPSIAYYDEPKFLKMQELIKLILAVEWLYKEKGVRVNEEWMMNHTSESNDACLELSTRKEPPSKMVPKPAVFKQPSSDVAVKTWELQLYRTVSRKCTGERRFGYYDFKNASAITFKGDGTRCPPQKYLNCGIEFHSTALPEEKVQFFFPIMLSPTEFRDKILESLPPPTAIAATSLAEESGKVTESLQPGLQLSLPPLTVMTTVTDGKLYTDEDPNQLIQPEIPGVFEAKVKSWEELITEWTVPIPCTWAQGTREPSAMGGVSTRNFRVEEKPLRTMTAHKETQWIDNYKKSGHLLVVRAEHVRAQGTIRLVHQSSGEFQKVSRKFSDSWKKNNGGFILGSIFAVTNRTLERQFDDYRQRLTVTQSEPYFHGTTLNCDIRSSQSLCSDPNCGICGISSAGMDNKCIGKNIDFQRFGRAFYLAPNSSKCHDYTEGANGYRAMLLCDVLPGRKCIRDHNNPRLTDAPQGFDSVCGQVGSKLNFPEVAVYKPEAVMPRYIIVYQKDGTKHPLAS